MNKKTLDEKILEAQEGEDKSVQGFIKKCKKKGGILDYMRKEIRKCNSCNCY